MSKEWTPPPPESLKKGENYTDWKFIMSTFHLTAQRLKNTAFLDVMPCIFIVTDKNSIQEKIESRFNSGNA